MILPEAEAILGSAGARINIRKGTFVGVLDGFAQVDMGGSRFVCDFGSGYIPAPGDTVRVWTVEDQHFVFSSGPRPSVGTVVTISNNRANLDTVIGTVSAAFSGSTPTSGDRVGIVWGEEGAWCSEKLSSTLPPTPTPIPPPVTQLRSATFRAIDAGSTDRNQVRWWTGQPNAGNSSYGAWFYGSQLKDTIPAGAVLESMEMYISKQKSHPAAPNFTLHTSGWKQGIPAMSGSLAWNPDPGWNYVPNSAWFDALKAGGTYWGIGLNQGGYTVYSSLAEDSMSGALRIVWRS